MAFFTGDELPQLELFPKALSGIAQGEQLMLSFLVLEQGCQIPEHSHPHEQAGLVMEGKLRFRIGADEKVAGPGDAFIAPPNVVHEGEVLEGPCRVLDIFSPPREDYAERYNKFLQTSSTTVWE